MPDPTNGPTITVVTRVGCHLCDDAHRIAQRVGADLHLRVVIRDVDEEPELGHLTDLVPVILIDGAQHQHWRIDEQRLRDALPMAGRPSSGWRRLWRH